MPTIPEYKRAQTKEAYLRMEARGIVAYLDMMEELDESEREEVLLATLKRLGRSKTRYDCPFHFFCNLLGQIQKHGIDAGTRLLDRTCGEIALMWQSTGETNH